MRSFFYPMLKYYYILSMFLITTTVLAQKKMEKIVAANNVEKLIIDGTHFSEINIRSQKTQDITMVANVNGETFENVLLKTNLDDGHFSIAAGYTPFFKKHDDKLAAHKVLSLELDIYVPEHIDIDVVAVHTNISFQGIFGIVNTQLATGNCFLDKFQGAGDIVCKKGAVSGTVDSRVLIANMLKKQKPHSIVTKNRHFLLRITSKGGKVSITQTE